MKKLILSLVVIVSTVFVSCNKLGEAVKQALYKKNQHAKGCAVIAQSSPYIDEEPRSQLFGFRKVINPATGMVDSLITATGGLAEVDSFYYAFTYFGGNSVHVEGASLTYNRLNSEHIWQLATARGITWDVQFNAQGNATTLMVGPAVAYQFNYSNGRLISVDVPGDPPPGNHFAFSYDNKGNLTQMKRGDDQNNFIIAYTYDLTKKAKSQIYSPTIPFHLFEIMGWIPIAPENLRLTQVTSTHNSNGDQVIADLTFSNHQLDNGSLKSFNTHIGSIDLDATIVNTLDCSKK